ncbi:RloB family protein [Mucilaginibacter roseus]|uniref:RloB family protein n=1 Tax=Mucilaginibacter roseus TaxID=1528868 RepID=A0ABS8TZB3_9SPHI|nr:RloB family protein [Mucilaginibacter roseus]MCD8740218.1 RloB family protein [Mucilaginibacter roseus]
MRKQKKIIQKANPAFAIVVDGETEIWYLQMLKRNERDIRISIKPEIPNKKSLEDQYKLACDLSKKEFTKVFWIVDFDTVVKEESEKPKGKKSLISTFNDYKAVLAEEYPNVVVIVNNPCLEFWFLLHFEKTSKYFRTCSEAENQLKKHLKNYEKTQKYFTKQNDDIYLKLKPEIKNALQNAIALGNFDSHDPTKAMCEMGLFFLTEELKQHFE